LSIEIFIGYQDVKEEESADKGKNIGKTYFFLEGLTFLDFP